TSTLQQAQNTRGHPFRGDPGTLAEEFGGGLPEDLEVVVREFDRLQEAFVTEVPEALEDVVPVSGLIQARGLQDIIQPEVLVSPTSCRGDGLEDHTADGLNGLLLGGALLTPFGLLGEGEGTFLHLEEATNTELEDLDRREALDGGVEGSEDRGGEGLGHDELLTCW
ncbi:hypothetical protein BSN82_17565, partial [Acinetobacter baylyi]